MSTFVIPRFRLGPYLNYGSGSERFGPFGSCSGSATLQITLLMEGIAKMGQLT
jgi:hypothetical protein